MMFPNRLRPALLALAALGSAACLTAKGATLQQLQTRAVFDLGCAQPELVIYHVDERTKAVAGCGRRLVYVESCQAIRGKLACTWILDTPTFAQAEWPERQDGARPQPFVWARQPAAPTPGRPVATQLFEPGAQPVPAPPGTVPGPAVAPQPAGGSPTPAASAGTVLAPAQGAPRRAHPDSLFDGPGSGSSGGGATTSPAGRAIPTELFDPQEP